MKAGVNFANQQFKASGLSISADGRTGFHVGGYLNVAFSEKFGIQPELLYNSVGSKFADEPLSLDYVSVPVMLKWSPAPIFNIHVGPQFGFLLSAKSDGEDVKDGFKGMDLGAGFGAGVDLPMGLGFQARYVLGLSNIAEAEEDFDDLKVTNTAFQLSVTYKLFGGE